MTAPIEQKNQGNTIFILLILIFKIMVEFIKTLTILDFFKIKILGVTGVFS